MDSSIDVSVFPIFKEQTLGLLGELEAIYVSNQFSDAAKASHFHRIMQKYDCLP